MRPDAPRNWRDRVALAAYAQSGEADPQRARHTVDRAVAAAGLAAGLLAILGAIVGFTTAGELLRRANGPVHAAAALMVLVGVPWLLVLLRGVVLAILRRRGGGLIGRLVPAAARTVAARDGDPSNRTLGLAVANQLGRMLAGPPGRWLATFGSGLFWCGYALAAFAAIWLLTARVALGFGWESSWLPPELGQAVVETSAAPLQPFFGDIELEPVDPPPITAADDHTALELRRVWVIYLSGGVLLYLLLPMGVWTILAGSLGHVAAERWRPHAATGVKARAARRTGHRHRTMTAHTLPDGDSITAVAGLERPAGQLWPPPLAGATTELDIVHDANSLTRATGRLGADSDSRVAIVAWLPATPDRGVERQVSALAEASARGGVLVLDGGDALRSREPSETVAIRHADWSALAKACGVPVVDFDFTNLTDTSQAAWLAFLGGTAISTSTDPAPLDASFAAISAALDADPPLPDERTAGKLAGKISRIHGAAGRSVLQVFTETNARCGARSGHSGPERFPSAGETFFPPGCAETYVGRQSAGSSEPSPAWARRWQLLLRQSRCPPGR